MPLRDDLLNPIPGDNPGGQNLQYDPIYEEIKKARVEEEGDFLTEEPKVADWKRVIKLSGEVLAARSKDLQVAAWLTEALVKTEGQAGLRDGLALLRDLVGNFWDNLYPEIEEGDAELRVARLDWVGSALNRTFKLLPITKTGLNWFDYKQASSIGHEADADTEKKTEDYQAAVRDGKTTGEMWDDAFKVTSKDYYRNMVQTLDAILENIDGLKAVCEEKFTDEGPSFSPLRTAVEEVRHTVNSLWMQKRKADPDPEDLQGEAGEQTAGEGGEQPVAQARGAAWGVRFDDDGAGADAQAFELASMSARAGNLQEALRILTAALLNEKCGRRRFLRKTQIAQICVEASKEDIALPLLEELQAEIDARRLEEWESQDLIARPLALLFRCMVKLELDAEGRGKLYGRVCRLSPLEAFTCNR